MICQLKMFTWSSSGNQGLALPFPPLGPIFSSSLLLAKLRLPLQCVKDGEEWWRKLGPSWEEPRLKLDPSWEKVLLGSIWCLRPTAVKVEGGEEVVRQASLLVAVGNSARNMTMCCTDVELGQQKCVCNYRWCVRNNKISTQYDRTQFCHHSQGCFFYVFSTKPSQYWPSHASMLGFSADNPTQSVLLLPNTSQKIAFSKFCSWWI